MELRNISTFLQVAQLQSFSKAANELGYSQAAVTIQIRQLETELDTRLFDRIGKRTTLTHEGAVLYEYALDVMKDIARMKEGVAKPHELTGDLRVGTIESICASLLPPILKEYHRRYPDVNVSIVTDSPDKLLDMLNYNALDIVYFLDKRMYDTKWVKVMEEVTDIIFVCAADHPFAKREPVSMEELIQEPFILTEKDASYRFILEQYLIARGEKIHPYLEISNTEFIVNLLRENMGLSFLPEYTVEKDRREGRIAQITVSDFYMRAWRQIVYHKDKWVTKEMSAFIELAKSSETK